MPEQITDKLVKSLDQPATGNHIVWDDRTPALGSPDTPPSISRTLGYPVWGRRLADAPDGRAGDKGEVEAPTRSPRRRCRHSRKSPLPESRPPWRKRRAAASNHAARAEDRSRAPHFFVVFSEGVTDIRLDESRKNVFDRNDLFLIRSY